MSDHVRSAIRAIVHEEVEAAFQPIHRKVDGLLLAVLHLLTRDPHMAIHDDILAALTSNDAALVAVGAKADAVIAEKSASDAAFSDVLPRVTAQGSAIAALDAKLAAAAPAPPVDPASSAPAETVPVEAPAEPVASDAPAPVVQPSIVIPTPTI